MPSSPGRADALTRGYALLENLTRQELTERIGPERIPGGQMLTRLQRKLGRFFPR